jgi:hypothetical protein
LTSKLDAIAAFAHNSFMNPIVFRLHIAPRSIALVSPTLLAELTVEAGTGAR